MSKRFTDTEKYKKKFIRGLPGAYKLLWDFVCLDCDHAGIWEVDFEIAQIHIGKDMPVEELQALEYFNKDEQRIVQVDNGKKWFIVPFIAFQYGRLRNNNSAHISVLRSLEKYDLLRYTDGDSHKLLHSDSIDKDKRHKILKECKGQCLYCGSILTDEFEIDHIIPTIKGGSTSDENLVACCLNCNKYKSDFSLDEFIKRRSLDGTEILERLISAKKGLFSPYQGAKDKDKDKDKDKEGEYEGKQKKFIPPTLKEVIDYCKERNNKVNPEKWNDHYLSNGWMVGKNKMKDWKATIRKWEQSSVVDGETIATRYKLL